MAAEKFQELMMQIGPAMELTDVTREDEALWSLVVSDDVLIMLTLEPESEKLTVGTVLGAPHDSRLPGIYEHLLMFNSQWGETGGVRMALSEAGGDVTMFCDQPAHRLDLSDLVSIVESFVEAARAWREAITSPKEIVEEPDNPESPMSSMIRV